MFAVDCTPDKADWHRRSIKVTTPLEEKKTREVKTQNPRIPSFSAHSKSTHSLKVDQRHRRRCSNTHRKEVCRTDGAEVNSEPRIRWEHKHQCARIECAFMCKTDPAHFPRLSSSPDSHTGRRHDGHMWTCGHFRKEKAAVNWKRQRTETLSNISLHSDKPLSV